MIVSTFNIQNITVVLEALWTLRQALFEVSRARMTRIAILDVIFKEDFAF